MSAPARILVVSPHPDDEAIGCGGALRLHADAGETLRAVFLTSGEGGGHGTPDDETRRIREREAHAAAAILGIESLEFWRETDGSLRATAALAHRLAALLDAWKPSRIYVPHDREQHPDHRAAARLVQRALAARSGSGAPEVFLFEVWTPLSRMDEIVDVTSTIDAKIEAIRSYASQCRVLGFDAAFRGLARYRGEMHSWPGGPYAEVFARMP